MIFNKLTVAWSQHALGGVVRAIDMDERTLASLQLAQQIAVEPFGYVEWLEIMEPRAQKIGKGVVGLEHMEFSVPDLDEVSRTLLRYGVRDYERQSNPGHDWLSIVINEAGKK